MFIKVPVTEQGLKEIRALKEKGIGVTATAINTKVQGMLAMEAGVLHLTITVWRTWTFTQESNYYICADD